MRQIKEVLRLNKYELNFSVREIARRCAVPTITVGDYLKRAESAGILWPIPEDWRNKSWKDSWARRSRPRSRRPRRFRTGGKSTRNCTCRHSI